MTKKVLDRFRVNRVEIRRPHLWVEVVVYESKAAFLKKVMGKGMYSRTAVANFSAVIDPKPGYRNPTNNGRMGTISLWPSPKMDLYAMHEAVHAAFTISRYRMKWDYSDEYYREEFIARCSEWIYERMRARFKKKNWYKS